MSSKARHAHVVDHHDDGSVPWHDSGASYSLPGIVGLHEEIEACYSWLKQTPAEEYVRGFAVRELCRVTRALWPKVEIEVMGSFSTSLCLPSSDVDLVMFGMWTTAPLNTLADTLHSCGYADPSKTVIVDTARVPVIKVSHAATRTKFDISFNQLDGLRTSELLYHYVRRYPNFPKIYLLVKQMLVRRDLNECFAGGISSFSLALIVVFFFQRLEEEDVLDRMNLGVLLLEFLEYYGCHFDFQNYGIDVCSKRVVAKRTHQNIPNPLYIVNPLNMHDQVAASTKLIELISQMFAWAFATLSACVFSTTTVSDSVCLRKRTRGVLGKLVQLDEEALDWRQRAQELYDHRILGQVCKEYLAAPF